MAELFQTTVPNVSMHLHNVYAEEELQEKTTVKEFLTVRQKRKNEATEDNKIPCSNPEFDLVAKTLKKKAGGIIHGKPPA